MDDAFLPSVNCCHREWLLIAEAWVFFEPDSPGLLVLCIPATSQRELLGSRHYAPSAVTWPMLGSQASLLDPPPLLSHQISPGCSSSISTSCKQNRKQSHKRRP